MASHRHIACIFFSPLAVRVIRMHRGRGVERRLVHSSFLHI